MRPMVLTSKETIDKLYNEWTLGVPVLKLINKYQIDLTPPTLAKLLRFYDAARKSTTNETRKIIENSLFPVWIINKELKLFEVMFQPAEYYYTGRMPLGEWKQRTEQ